MCEGGRQVADRARSPGVHRPSLLSSVRTADFIRGVTVCEVPAEEWYGTAGPGQVCSVTSVLTASDLLLLWDSCTLLLAFCYERMKDEKEHH